MKMLFTVILNVDYMFEIHISTHFTGVLSGVVG
jgi:hypothetical protein